MFTLLVSYFIPSYRSKQNFSNECTEFYLLVVRKTKKSRFACKKERLENDQLQLAFVVFVVVVVVVVVGANRDNLPYSFLFRPMNSSFSRVFWQ